MRVQEPSPRGCGVENPVLCAIQVSTHLGALDVHSINLSEGNRALFGLVLRRF
jgi:hypothetical protein